MTETELKQIAWDAQIESEKLQYLKDRAKETLVISEKCYQKRRDLEDLYCMVDTALSTAQTEEIKAFDAYRFWLMKVEEHKTGE